MATSNDTGSHPRDQRPDWKAHWEHVYAEKPETEISWYQSHPEHSLAMIAATGTGLDADIIDVGGGASTLSDHLLEAGYGNITVLDIAHGGIKRARARMGIQARQVTWIEQDVTTFRPEQQYDIWHDRAVFHFLVSDEDRARYLEVMYKALKPNGQAIIATFAENGPDECSGLDVIRYSADSLNAEVGDSLHLVETRTEEHRTPVGGIQQFIYCRFSQQ